MGERPEMASPTVVGPMSGRDSSWQAVTTATSTGRIGKSGRLRHIRPEWNVAIVGITVSSQSSVQPVAISTWLNTRTTAGQLDLSPDQDGTVSSGTAVSAGVVCRHLDRVDH